MTFKVVGAPIYTRILKLIIHYLKKRDQVHKELPVSFTEKTNIFEKKEVLSICKGPPWRVGPDDLVKPVSMLV